MPTRPICHFSMNKKAAFDDSYLNSISQPISVCWDQIEIGHIEQSIDRRQFFRIFSVAVVLASPEERWFSIDLVANKKVVLHQTSIVQLQSSQHSESPFPLFSYWSVVPSHIQIFGYSWFDFDSIVTLIVIGDQMGSKSETEVIEWSCSVQRTVDIPLVISFFEDAMIIVKFEGIVWFHFDHDCFFSVNLPEEARIIPILNRWFSVSRGHSNFCCAFFWFSRELEVEQAVVHKILVEDEIVISWKIGPLL